MAVLVDTSVLVDVERHLRSIETAVGEADRTVSAITASELLHGVHRATEVGVRVRREAFVEHVIATMDPIPITTAVARTHARIWAALQREGAPIGAHDLWIAATAVAHGLSLVTVDVRHFERVPGLAVVGLRT